MGKPYMPLMVGDWIKGTRGMRAEARGVYLGLLLHQFEAGFIPSALDDLSLIEPEVGKVWGSIKDKFKEFEPGKLRNEKLVGVISFWEKQAKNGKKGGRPKTGNPNHIPDHNPNDNPNHNHHNDLDIDNEYKLKGLGGAGEREWPEPKPIEDCRLEFLSDTEQVNLACKSLGVKPESIPGHMEKFITHLKYTKEAKKTRPDFDTHFVNFTRKKLNAYAATSKNRTTNSSAIIEPKSSFGWNKPTGTHGTGNG